MNTVDPRHADERDDCLGSYTHLLRWSAQAGLLTAGECSGLERRSQQEPGLAGAVHRRALELREALYRLFAAEHPAQVDIARLSNEAHRAWTEAKLVLTDDVWSWRWDASAELDRVLWPIAWSAAELLTSGRRSRIRECEGHNGCGWLFLDTSKNGRRRWCDMRVCGNRAKARRHRQREAAASLDEPRFV